MNTDPYEFKYTQSEVRESSQQFIDSTILICYRSLFACICCSAYVSFFVFNSLHTARVLAAVSALVALFDLFLSIYLSIFHQHEK